MISFRSFIKLLLKGIRMMMIRFKPLTVHTEAIFYDHVWDEVKKRCGNKKVHTWYLMTPKNYKNIKNYFWLTDSCNVIERKMKKRYLEMKKMGERLQLHVHLHPLLDISYEEQENLITASFNWLKKNIGVEASEIVFGWWRYNSDSKKIAKKLGLNIIKFDDFDSIHDFDWVINCIGEAPYKG